MDFGDFHGHFKGFLMDFSGCSMFSDHGHRGFDMIGSWPRMVGF